MRQNAGPILALAVFKCVLKYQELMPNPSDSKITVTLQPISLVHTDGGQKKCHFFEMVA